VELGAAGVVVGASVVPAAIALVKLAFVTVLIVASAMAIAVSVTPLVFVFTATLVSQRQAGRQQSGSGNGTYGSGEFFHHNLSSQYAPYLQSWRRRFGEAKPFICK
jgi:hypothetical protein